ncbi:hypothetical protein [Luteitalea sp.]|uniref:hypothetical protein n=1 Tax=Luteitalea sp. TaxID=2004800 RepID=UPI0025BC6515|nr:hypothetical protein [Luteitalea sp.]
MESISPRRVRTALCDQEGFYPFRSLVTGNLSSLEELALAERFARAIVLHDAMVMEGEPMPAPEDEHEWSEEEIAAGGRNVIVAFMPDLTPYGALFGRNLGPDPLRDVTFELSEPLKALAIEMSGAGSGDPYHRAHERYLHKLTSTLRSGASIVCGGAVGSALRVSASQYPEQLFAVLDRETQEFAREAHAAHLGVAVPPILSIALKRCDSRENLVNRLIELRDEWHEPRARLWDLIEQLRASSDVREMRTIQRELGRVSEAMSPGAPAIAIEPSRVLWDLVAGAASAGVAVATEGPISQVVAIATAAGAAIRELQPVVEYIFGRGAIDLARRIRSEVIVASRTPELLDRFLTDQERRALRG